MAIYKDEDYKPWLQNHLYGPILSDYMNTQRFSQGSGICLPICCIKIVDLVYHLAPVIYTISSLF